jgi:N-acetyl sugar amidotransferase
MSNIQFCKRCLYANTHPLGLTFNSDGLCSGCQIHEEKDKLDWNERWLKLEKIIKPYRNRPSANYNCIVPVTGSQDSYFTVYLVKEKLGLNPLLVNYNKYFNTPLGIRNLANLRIKFNCDILSQNINPIKVKKITRSTFRQFGSIYWPIHAGHTVFPVQTAVRFKIPLIIWGAHQGLEQVGMFSHEHEVEMSRRYRKDHDLMGYEAEDLLSTFDTLSEADICQYKYPEDKDLHEVGVRGIYLGNYVRWDPVSQHKFMVKKYDYQSANFSRTFDSFDYVDCFNYMDMHDQLKLYKHGFSKVTDHACREIRHGRLTREEGLALVRYYEQKPIKYSNLFLDWLGVTERSLEFMMNQFKNPYFWTEVEFNKWIFNGLSSRHRDKNHGEINHSNIANIFEVNSSLETDYPPKYITIGKGYP